MLLKETRFARYFDFIGDFPTHYRTFPGCGTTMAFSAVKEGGAAACC